MKIVRLTPRAVRARVYKPSFLDVLASKQTDVSEAKKRVTIDPRTKKYKYEPSKEYKHFLSKFV